MIFRIDLKIFLIIILYILTKQIKIFGLIIVFALLHEIAHILAGLLLKLKIQKIELMPAGLSIQFKLNIEDYNIKIGKSNILEIKKIIIALAGPLFNILVVIFVAIIGMNTSIKTEIVYANLLIAIFNLIPLYPLDGGRILKSILNITFGRPKSNQIMTTISNTILTVITVIFSILIYYYKNISLLIIIIYLWYIVLRENKILRLKTKIYKLMS